MVLLFPKFAGKDLPFRVIGELMLLSLPFIVALVFPMAVLLGVIMAFGRLSSDNEITAFKALGVPAHRLMWTPMVAAALLTVVAIWFNDRVLPETNHRYKNLLVDIAYLKPTLQLEEGVVMDDFPGMSLLVNRIRQSGGGKSLQPVEPTAGGSTAVPLEEPEQSNPADLFGVIISESGENSRTILADSGAISFLPNRRDAMLTLYHGEIQEVDPRRKAASSASFSSATASVCPIWEAHCSAVAANAIAGSRDDPGYDRTEGGSPISEHRQSDEPGPGLDGQPARG